MGIAELINKEKKTAFSFEVLPPLKGTGIEKLYATIDTLREFDPLYVNITTHRSEYVYRELGGGLYERNRCTFHTHRNFKISRLYKEMIIKFIAQIHIFYFHFIVSEIQIQFCKPFFV